MWQLLTRKQAENDAIAKLTVKLQSTVHKPIPECARDQRAVCAKKDEVCRARYVLLSARGAVVNTATRVYTRVGLCALARSPTPVRC